MSQVWTQQYTGAPLAIAASDNVLRFAVKAVGGTVNITGNIAFKGMNAQAIPLAENDSFVMQSGSNNGCVATIDPNGNTAVIAVFFN